MKRTSLPAGRKRSLRQALREYARGIAGGLLFSLPLLYTMEVWWAGFISRPIHLLVYFGVGFLLLFGYNRYAGLHKDASWLEVAIEAVEEMGLGILIAAGALWLLGQIDGDMLFPEVAGKIVVEAVTVAIGVSAGASQLGGSNREDDDQGMEGNTRAQESSGSITSQVVLAACGAVLFASNVAPTEEVVLIAIESTRWKLVGLALLSLALGGLILFYSDFRGAEQHRDAGPGKVASRTLLNYAVALVVSAFILWFFGRFDGASLPIAAAQIVVLGVAASLGASAGRLLLQ